MFAFDIDYKHWSEIHYPRAHLRDTYVPRERAFHTSTIIGTVLEIMFAHFNTIINVILLYPIHNSNYFINVNFFLLFFHI